MLRIILNGEPATLPAAQSVDQALEAWGYVGKPYAVAVNGDFVPRHRHAETALRDGDAVEVLAPMQGG